MKKKIFLLSMLLCCVGNAMAQQLSGSWLADKAFQQAYDLIEKDLEMNCVLEFEREGSQAKDGSERGTVIIGMTAKGYDEEIGTISMAFLMDGSYTKKGNLVKTKMNRSDVKSIIVEIVPNDPEIKALLDTNEEAKQMIYGAIEQKINQQDDDNIKKIAELADVFKEFTVKRLTKRQMTVSSQGTEITFNRDGE